MEEVKTMYLEKIKKELFDYLVSDGYQKKKVLMVIPDTTRTAPVGKLVRIVKEVCNQSGAHLDLMIALGTHQPLSRETVFRHLGVDNEREYLEVFGETRCFNHTWNDPSSLVELGSLSPALVSEVSNGLLEEEIKITINKKIFEYDHLMILGPVFPHEIAGFSGGSKYFFPGISGPEMIDHTHWLGALITNLNIIGKANNPVRSILDMGASLVPIPVTNIAFVVHQNKIAGIFVGELRETWRKAVALSEKLHVVYKPHPYRKVIACAPKMYEDLWTGGKCMYKCEPVVEDGGELVIYAPHITSLSYTHGHILEEIGYHVRDYYLQNMEQYKEYPRAVLAVSTLIKGQGTYQNGIERPRIKVILATGIPPEVCEKVGLGYINPESINLSEYENKEDEGILLVPKAGETLYRLAE
jgi:nickel-dependent lactate racemase